MFCTTRTFETVKEKDRERRETKRAHRFFCCLRTHHHSTLSHPFACSPTASGSLRHPLVVNNIHTGPGDEKEEVERRRSERSQCKSHSLISSSRTHSSLLSVCCSSIQPLHLHPEVFLLFEKNGGKRRLRRTRKDTAITLQSRR